MILDLPVHNSIHKVVTSLTCPGASARDDERGSRIDPKAGRHPDVTGRNDRLDQPRPPCSTKSDEHRRKHMHVGAASPEAYDRASRCATPIRKIRFCNAPVRPGAVPRVRGTAPGLDQATPFRRGPFLPPANLVASGNSAVPQLVKAVSNQLRPHLDDDVVPDGANDRDIAPVLSPK